MVVLRLLMVISPHPFPKIIMSKEPRLHLKGDRHLEGIFETELPSQQKCDSPKSVVLFS